MPWSRRQSINVRTYLFGLMLTNPKVTQDELVKSCGCVEYNFIQSFLTHTPHARVEGLNLLFTLLFGRFLQKNEEWAVNL